MAAGAVCLAALMIGAALGTRFGARALFLVVVAWLIAIAVAAFAGAASPGDALILALAAAGLTQVGFFVSIMVQARLRPPPGSGRPPPGASAAGSGDRLRRIAFGGQGLSPSRRP